MEKIIVSACLLGAATRYDAKSKPSISEEKMKKLTEAYHLVPVCPEIYGGLPTPRIPSERVGERVKMQDGRDVTENYNKGALETLSLCRLLGVKKALLKAKSPSCSKDKIYDGSFSGSLTKRDGVTAERLISAGLEVYTESCAEKLL